MTQVYLELSTLIALANSSDLFHDETKKFLDEIKRVDLEPISCKQAVEMDLAIGLAKRPLRVADALRMMEVIGTCGIKLLDTQSRTLLMLVKEYRKQARLNIGDLLHYAGATLLNTDYLASWNTDDFNPRFEKSVNRVNRRKNLKTIKVGTPTKIIEWIS
jgi:uncharacterized protein with PIN domain